MQDAEEITVKDAMTRGVICVDVKDTVQEAAEVMKRNDISGVIVTKKGGGVGIVTERDIICKIVADGKNPKKTLVKEVMTAPLITIKPTMSIDDAARVMRNNDIRRLVVTDKDRVIGVLSEFDIVRMEPALHLLITEKAEWKLHEAHAAEKGMVAGICESCGNFAESLTAIDGRLLCDECAP